MSLRPAFVKWVHMPHSSLYKKNSPSGISLSASMKYLFEKKYWVGFFLWKNVKQAYELLMTDICMLTRPIALDSFYRRAAFYPQTNWAANKHYSDFHFLACFLLYLCTAHPALQLQMCFFQVGEAKDMTPKIIMQYTTDLKEEDLFQYSSQNTKSSPE